jgi:hypothetical protein
MGPDQELFDDLFLSKVRAAQRLTPQERLQAALEHSDNCVHILRSGVRHQFPDATPEEVEQQLIERVRTVKRMQEGR